MFYNSTKIFVKKFPPIWNLLRGLKDSLIKISRLKDVFIMMTLFHLWPEQTYRFSTRKLLPCKKNRNPKESKLIIPFKLIKSESSNMPMMKEINVIARGSSFNLNNIKEINGPIFLTGFWSPLQISSDGNLIYTSVFSYETGKFQKYFKGDQSLEKFLSRHKKSGVKNYKKNNITYVISRKNSVELLMKEGHNILAITACTKNENGDYCPSSSPYLNFKNNNQLIYMLVEEKVYKHPMITSYPKWAPVTSTLSSICVLSYFAEKINVYGWDYYLNSSPKNMSYWKLLLNMYVYSYDVNRSNNHFESALINFYYAYHLSKLPNINIHGYLGQLDKHKKLIDKIERVLFN